MLAFVDKLQQEGIFAKHVNSSGVAFHSTAMADISHQFRSALKQVSHIPIYAFVFKQISHVTELRLSKNKIRFSNRVNYTRCHVSSSLTCVALQ